MKNHCDVDLTKMNVSIIEKLLNKEGWDAGAVVRPPA